MLDSVSSEPETTDKAKTPRRPISGWEILSLPLWTFAAFMMMADYVATEARPLTYLPSIAPWYITHLSWMGPVFVVACWVLFRRWLGAWVPLLAYMVVIVGALSLVGHVINQRVETIDLARPLDISELGRLEQAIGERVCHTTATGQPPRLLIRRDPQVHEQVTRWLQDHGR